MILDKHILLLGKPCSGKGTLSKDYQSKGFYHLGGSDMLRDHINDPTAKYYNEAKYSLDNGIMISDEIINGIFEEKFNTIPSGKNIVFDGYPRSVSQIEAILSKTGVENVVCILIDVEDDICLKRLENRLTCKGCAASFSKEGKYKPKVEGICDHCGSELYVRPDDKYENFVSKIKEYDLKTKPIIDYIVSKKIQFIVM